MTDPISEIQRQNLAVYEVSPGRLREDISQEAQVAHDYRGRLAYELLQNADDAMEASDAATDRVAFIVTDDALWVANTGRPFTVADVQGLCGLGESSKVDAQGTRRASIGHKGLGFKSVLEITDAPIALSTTYSFELGERHARPAIRELLGKLDLPIPPKLPAMRFPAELATVPARWDDLRDEGYRAAFYFPFADRVEASARTRLADLLLELPVTTVLFLKHLEEVSVIVETGGRQESRHWKAQRSVWRDGAWSSIDGLGSSGLYRISVAGGDEAEPTRFLLAHENEVSIGDNRDGLSGPAWEGVELSEVSLAILDPDVAAANDMPEDWRRFHVFLPTAERCPYPILVNGAFTTDLSRQRVRIDRRGKDYNAHLVKQAARLFRDRVAPRLLDHGAARLLASLDRREVDADDSTAASLLHEALVEELRDLAFVPTGDTHVELEKTVVPPSELGETGPELRRLLRQDVEFQGRRLPDPELCTVAIARIAADHGARRLAPTEVVSLLATEPDPEATRLEEHESGGFALDPVLELLAALWSNADADVRSDIEELAKASPLFPVHAEPDGSITRVPVAGSSAFYPPQSAKKDLPLTGLAFMLHDVCWGALLPNERKSLLDDRMTVWHALFDVSEFRFEEVMRASVLPGLVLNPEGDALRLRERLEDTKILAAVCQLAGKQPKPDRPLRYQRLQSDRALFNLSRLPVPCRGSDGAVVWVPAYRVYFGREWVGDASIESLVETAQAQEVEFDVPILAPPETFLGLLEDLADVNPEEADTTSDADEVGLDEDLDSPLETNERDRWMSFLSWIGVNTCLRPVHFHDVEDRDGWLTTKELAQPKGWAFAGLGETWQKYRDYLENRLEGLPAATGTVPYLYECHDLEALALLVDGAERDATADLARALFAHLARHWETYSRFDVVELALVGEGKWPSHRTSPQRALPEERHDVGDNLWVFRLRRSGFCPTTHGPRKPSAAWMPGAEVDRRFGRRGRTPGDLLPLLDLGEAVTHRSTRRLAERVGVRLELSPSSFGVEDAQLVASRLATLYGDGGRAIDNDALRRVIKPTYREVFELLSGTGTTGVPQSDTPMLAETADGYRFLPAQEMLYARSPGTKQRSGVGSRVSTFVLEAEPSANAPLASVFGMPTLEDALDWAPDPGELALDDDEMETFRRHLRELTPILLARLRVERAGNAAQDRDRLLEFVEVVEPVTHLDVACSLNGETVTASASRTYFVEPSSRGQALQAFLVWEGPAWPPAPDVQQALAMAIADALGVNLVETFLAFIDGDESRRLRLLDLAGATGHLDEILLELTGDDQPADPNDAAPGEPTKSAAPEAGTRDEDPTGATPVVPRSPATPGAIRIPLVSFDDFDLAGEISIVVGERENRPVHDGSQERRTSPGSPPNQGFGARRAAAGTDLNELDELGMRITMAYEVRRVRSTGSRIELLRADVVPEASSLVIDVSTPAAIAAAIEQSAVAKEVFAGLRARGVSELYPGFDVLTVVDGQVDRMIELKSSGVDARVQSMSWNEWKSARAEELRKRFWLYLVGNLRADIPAPPFVRAIRDPFGTLLSEETAESTTRRAVQLLVRQFDEAEQLVLAPREGEET